MFDAQKFIDEKVEELRGQIQGHAIIGCSGGVDSTVATVLVAKAVGDKLKAVFVDTGYMRKNEASDVEKIMQDMKVNYSIVDASQEFFSALAGVVEPETKRKIIGERFIRVFERESKEWDSKYLVQGTIAPDWIESGGGPRDTIKSHHNVGGLPEQMGLELVEPLRDLYKDEVRKVGRTLGIPTAERQPFPGPGIAVRILGEATPEAVHIVQEASAIAEEEMEKAAERGEMELPWQYFAVLLPVKSVGVHGDVRAYGYTVGIRAVQSIDGMTAAYSKIPHPVLERISVRITTVSYTHLTLPTN